LEKVLAVAESGPVACILGGASGIGKTTLWRESIESARRRGYQVLETASSEPDAALAFSGLGDLFERIPDQALDTLPDVQGRALRTALFLSEAPESARGAAPITTVLPSIPADQPNSSTRAPSEAVSFAASVSLRQPPLGSTNTYAAPEKAWFPRHPRASEWQAGLDRHSRAALQRHDVRAEDR
jgi:hypothetical protein